MAESLSSTRRTLESARLRDVRNWELLEEPEAGRIVEGGPADFFLVHGDPLTDPTALWRVWRVAWLPEAPGRADPTRR